MRLSGDRNQCQVCKGYFNSVAAFDKHRVGPHGDGRRCLDEAEMLAKGMARNGAGFWVGSPMASAGDRYWQNSGDQDVVGSEVAVGPVSA